MSHGNAIDRVRAEIAFDKLMDRQGPLGPISEREGFILEAAMQLGFEPIDDDANIYVVNSKDLIAFVYRAEGVGAAKAIEELKKQEIAQEPNRLIKAANEAAAIAKGEIAAARPIETFREALAAARGEAEVSRAVVFGDSRIQIIHKPEDDGGELKVGDEVEKTGGDYKFLGTVQGVITKRSSAVRYVVESWDGILHIFNRKQLRKINPAA